MCLLITQSKFSPALSDEWLADFYEHNQDGVGVMYSESDTLIIEKALPASADAFVKFYRKHIQGRDCAFHLRMKTHGAIDLTNCHPYEVLNRKDHGLDLWLMHNGILATGNAADVSKSDTWHYIRSYLRPMLAENPEFFVHPSFAEIVGKHIGVGNKFVLMDHRGRMVTINRGEGVYWAGLWLSNEYAWSASDTTTDQPFDDPAIAQEQADEKPVKHKAAPSLLTYGSSSYYGSDYGSSYVGQVAKFDTDSESWARAVEDLLIDLEANGFSKAGAISYQDALDFADRFGLDALSDLCFMVTGAEITEDRFLQVLSDHDSALKYFPWLAECDYQSEDTNKGGLYE